jgi:hypothetical protein
MTRAAKSAKRVNGPVKAYDDFLKRLYTGVKPRVEEINVPQVCVLAVAGNEPPGGAQYQNAIAALYGVAYTLKMGMKFGKLPRPSDYFDYKVGALETLWWSTDGTLEISNPKTLRWQAYLMVPGFVTKSLVNEARKQAKEKHPEVSYEAVTLERLKEGRAIQILHVGPYNMEEPTVGALTAYARDHNLDVVGKHHEIYMSDPRRTPPGRLKTVIRLAVKDQKRITR